MAHGAEGFQTLGGEFDLPSDPIPLKHLVILQARLRYDGQHNNPGRMLQGFSVKGNQPTLRWNIDTAVPVPTAGFSP